MPDNRSACKSFGFDVLSELRVSSSIIILFYFTNTEQRLASSDGKHKHHDLCNDIDPYCLAFKYLNFAGVIVTQYFIGWLEKGKAWNIFT